MNDDVIEQTIEDDTDHVDRLQALEQKYNEQMRQIVSQKSSCQSLLYLE